MVLLRNEMDVREEIATPFLKLLGYESGTANDIRREHHLRYAALQLGRKKAADVKLPQGGAADYMLTVTGVGRWVLETKPPDEPITLDDIDQVASYSRHPEVAGQYFGVLNGKRFVLHSASQTSNDPPLVDMEVDSPGQLAENLESLLSPASIRRDYKPPIVDLRKPLAAGYRGEAAINGGWNKQLAVRVETALPLPPAVLANVNSEISKLIGVQSTLKGGRVWRDKASRIRAQLSWHAPHEEMKAILDAINLDGFEYLCLSESISSDSSDPSVFDIVGAFDIRQGQTTYDLLRWETRVFPVPVSVVLQGQATGYLEDGQFHGLANFREIMTIANLPIPITIHFETEFCFDVDRR